MIKKIYDNDNNRNNHNDNNTNINIEKKLRSKDILQCPKTPNKDLSGGSSFSKVAGSCGG